MLHVVTWDHVNNQKQNISNATPMANKLGRVVTYDKGNSSVMSDHLLIT